LNFNGEQQTQTGTMGWIMSDSLIPRPEIKDELRSADGGVLQLNITDTTLVFHQVEQYSEMDHIFIRKLGAHGLRVFNIHPWAEYLIGRGYDILIKQYPDDVTVAVWTNIQMQNMERELNGTGGELDDADE